MISFCDAWLPIYSTHCVAHVIVCARIYVRVYCTLVRVGCRGKTVQVRHRIDFGSFAK